MKRIECKIIGELQKDFPIVSNPYALIAKRLNMTENELIKHIQSLMLRGTIRKIGVALRHRKVGFKANALCVWQVPQEKVELVGSMFASLSMVTHCYERLTHVDWQYNLYTMVHALSEKQCEQMISRMSEISEVTVFRVFYSTKELKKISMRYFE